MTIIWPYFAPPLVPVPGTPEAPTDLSHLGVQKDVSPPSYTAAYVERKINENYRNSK